MQNISIEKNKTIVAMKRRLKIPLLAFALSQWPINRLTGNIFFDYTIPSSYISSIANGSCELFKKYLEIKGCYNVSN